MWLGGIASLAVILITGMAYNFAVSYLKQYPAEKVGPSSFACDDTIRNAKFESTLKALAVPVSEVEEPIFEALTKQKFTLKLELINTAVPCTKISIVEVAEAFTYALSDVKCSEAKGTASMSVGLPQHIINLRVVINDIQLVGGLRVGLSGPGEEKELHTLQELNFNQAFFSDTAETLAQQAAIQLTVTKVSGFFSHRENESDHLLRRSSTRRSRWRRVIPRSLESGIRPSSSARTRCSWMLIDMPLLSICRQQPCHCRSAKRRTTSRMSNRRSPSGPRWCFARCSFRSCV